MLQLHRNNDNTWTVTRDGIVIAADLSLVEAQRLYARLTSEQLASREHGSKKVFR